MRQHVLKKSLLGLIEVKQASIKALELCRTQYKPGLTDLLYMLD